ncbi:MGMT family protein [Acidipropionibacterium acidipropionici]|uniref:MGMT family protein n=1 Tax=Acidipropionibacterium acidipropionici TaxID=1748 RepID=UPI0005A21FC4
MGRVDGEELIDRVLLAADLVPRGRVVSYGDLAELVGTTARMVGRIMARHGHDVCWWRVVNASGHLPPALLGRAAPHWAEEGTRRNAAGTACRMSVALADLAALGERYRGELAAAGDGTR